MGAPPRLATSLGASIGTAPRLATSMMPPQRLAASMSAAPRLASSIGASIGAGPRLATSIGASIGAGPRLATSMFGGAPGRLGASMLGGPAPGASVSASIGAGPRLATSMFGGAPGRLGASMLGGPAPGRLQGVDLRLDNFELSEAKRVESENQDFELKSLDECVSIGNTFWSGLEGDSKIFKDEDRDLLRDVFNAKLADRRSEGDVFCPPDASHSYVTKLRSLVKEEEAVRQRRKALFFNKGFTMDEPGSLFPSSWTSSFESSARAEQRPHGSLVARPEYKEQASELLKDALRDGAPVFDKPTEEGMRFRIYSLGSLEVRTVQELGGEEIVGAVFSVQNAKALGRSELPDTEKVVKATEYVERTLGGGRGYFVVLETEDGNKVRMERLSSGKVAWQPNPDDLEDRSSLAKVINTSECNLGMPVGDMKAYQATMVKACAGTSPATGKHHAKNLFARATGAPGAGKASAFCPPMLLSPHLLKNISFVAKKD